MQTTPESVIEALNFVEKPTDREVNHLLKYVYPTATTLMIAFLTANGNYWIEQETAVLVYGYQKVLFPNQPSRIIYKILHHVKGFVNDASKNEIFLLMNESLIDPSANVTSMWNKTLYGFYK